MRILIIINKLFLIMCMTAFNVLITYLVSAHFFFSLLYLGKNIAFIFGIIAAVGTYAYLIFNCKIEQFITKGEKYEHKR